MRKVVSALGWIFVVLTMFSIIITVFSTYMYGRQVNYFTSYNALQVCLGVTMVTWAIKMCIDKKERAENALYCVLCTLIACGAMVFLYIGVY
ncbi:hypothetical protein [Clostridium akagii]|uniref:hypothetical protein n=1 Tax=Clostridium akagii TaxID=91623 RepID=UPI00047CD6FD|nr:hypothetical protein [Clostridium akagii]